MVDSTAPYLHRMSAGVPALDHAAADAKVSEIERLQSGHINRGEELRILELLRGSAPGELDYLARRISLVALVRDVERVTKITGSVGPAGPSTSVR